MKNTNVTRRFGQAAMLGLGLGTGVMLSAGALGLQDDDAVADPAAAAPLRMVLDVAGNSYTVKDGETFDIEVEGETLPVTIRIAPTRLAELPEVSFEFPREMVYAIDDSDPTYTSWELNGNDSLLLIFRYSDEITPQEVADSYVEGISNMFEAPADARSPSTIRLGDKEIKGTRLRIEVAPEVPLTQSAYAIEIAGATYLVVVQDSGDVDTGVSPEVTTLLEMVNRTWKPSL